ncbi:hypothetical protein Salat_1062600 [Sesamum alatum]|uniref:Uncharacterized protein n=1 Tax=Sesamum alatum TaxID=300844 RepID=A0AAE1YMC6_9LAMI|nr:hypothetical protein Salat_1062600 [Sesamum alatum]
MVMIQAKRHINMPPPAYHPESQNLTVGVFYGGELRNIPVATCIAAKALDHLGSREFSVYIEYKPLQPEEVAVECDQTGKHDKKNKKSKGKGKGKSKASENDDDFEFLGVENVEKNEIVIPPQVSNQPVADSQNLSPSILTEPGPSMTQPSMPGPSMYEQLQMAHNNISLQLPVTLQPRLNIRAPPPMTGTWFMPCFSSRPSFPVSKTITKEHEQKYVNLSNWPTSQSKEHGKK